MMFNVCGFGGEGVAGVGVSSMAWGDGCCRSNQGLTDRRPVGKADRGHPGPSWANMGPFMDLSNC